MAKKNVEGQMELFELFGSVEELEKSVKSVPAEDAPVMQRSYADASGRTADLAYLDYNMVYMKDWGIQPVIYAFDQAKDAVDFYVEQMERLSADRRTRLKKEHRPLEAAPVQKWMKEEK